MSFFTHILLETFEKKITIYVKLILIQSANFYLEKNVNRFIKFTKSYR